MTLLLLLAAAGGCTARESFDERLHSRCAVHLDELTSPPVVDLGSLTAPANPNAACDLYLFNHRAGEEEASLLVESAGWHISCPEGDSQQRCSVAVEPDLVDRYEDGLLLCTPAQPSCPGREENIGTRTLCGVDGDQPVELARIGPSGTASLVTGAVLAVDAFDDQGLVAATWMTSSVEDSAPRVSWIRTRPGTAEQPLGAVETIDVCQHCADDIAEGRGGAPSQGYVAFQTAGRVDSDGVPSILLAGPCGLREVLEVTSDGFCRRQEVTEVGGELSAAPQIVLGVIEASLGTFLAIWTDGVIVYASTLVDDGAGELDLRHVQLVDFALVTQSRERPSAICFGEGDDPGCLVLWTEVAEPPTEYDRVGDQEIFFNTFLTETSLGQEALIEGFGVRQAVARPAEVLEGLSGVLAYRHHTLGLLAERWDVEGPEGHDPEADPGAAPELEYEFDELILQLSRAEHVSDLALTSLGDDAFALAWLERDGEEPFHLELAALGLGEEDPRLTSTPVRIAGFDAAQDLFEGSTEAARPQLASSRNAERPLLMASAQTTEAARCQTRIAIADLADFEVGPDEIELLLDNPIRTMETPGACAPGCGGEVLALADGSFLLALPSLDGAAMWHVAPGREGGQMDVELVGEHASAGGPGCVVGIAALEDDERGTEVAAFFDIIPPAGEDPSLRGLILERLPAGSWVAETAEVMIDGSPAEGVSTPAFALHLAGEPLLLWTVHPFGDWPQHDFKVGRIEHEEESGLFLLSSIPYQYRPVSDSRITVAAGVAVPCDGEVAPEGDNLCAAIAMSRPDVSEFQSLEGPSQIEHLTPIAESVTVQVAPDAEEGSCSSCGSIQLVEGSSWRGLPTSLVGFREEGGDRHREQVVATFSESFPLSWEPGQAAGFRLFQERSESDEEESIWRSRDVAPGWVFGDGHQEVSVPFLRVATGSGGRLGGVWLRRERVDAERELYDVTMRFSLLDGDLRPLAAGQVISEELSVDLSGLDLSHVDNDVRFFTAEHLLAAISALDDDSFVVAWMERRWATAPSPEVPPSLDEISFHAAQVSCWQETSTQAP